MAEDPQLLPILTLQPLVERRFIRIGSAHYDLRNPGDMTIRQQLWLEANVPRFWTLLAKILHEDDEAQAVDETEADRIGNRILECALDAPAEVRSALSVTDRLQVIRAFLVLPKGSPDPSEAGPTEAGASSGDPLSPDASDSTAATPAPGSRKSRSH